MTDGQMKELKELIVQVGNELMDAIKNAAWDLERKIDNVDSSVSSLQGEISYLRDEIE